MYGVSIQWKSPEETEEDDYMSDRFLQTDQTSDRPGLLSKAEKRKMEIRQREEMQRNNRALVQEARARLKGSDTDDNRAKMQEALSKAITSDNLGYNILLKMGFKTGSSLGKKENGRKEPIPLNIKVDRKGLGHVNEAKRKAEEIRQMREEMKQKRAKTEETQAIDFANDMRRKQQLKQDTKDLSHSQKVCEQLDSAHEIPEPLYSFFWPEGIARKLAIAAETHSNSDTVSKSSLTQEAKEEVVYGQKDDDDSLSGDGESTDFFGFFTHVADDPEEEHCKNDLNRTTSGSSGQIGSCTGATSSSSAADDLPSLLFPSSGYDSTAEVISTVAPPERVVKDDAAAPAPGEAGKETTVDDTESDEEEEEEEQYPICDQLDMVTTYLRTQYFYCIWCGVEYNDREDIMKHCPGNTYKDHNE